MITDFVLDNSALAPVLLLLVVVVCVVLGYLALRFRRQDPAPVLWILAVLSTLPVVALTLIPTTARVDGVTCVTRLALPAMGRVELLANVALLLPLVFFAALATRRPLLTVVAGSGVSIAIEAAQAVLPVIGRACDSNDWAMNTAGAVIAGLLARAVIARTTR
ncbi:VanZ family protein [Umezawaea sp. Da 62-37]|uniref:VanZ family protein n=1 Tax=Umezawaea sp. Da 62-37 TaxID=3075927 RepID=UPI0028F6E357|nr:VanZ family protein [Umezawaea sp. Da 62-37]WNV86986.1 VanZ family protein [Umezawaea sp. Da 62-37]